MPRRNPNRAFTLVELMIVVAIVGVLAALGIYGVRRYIANAKTAEARNGVGRMAKDAATAYSFEGMPAALLPSGGTAKKSHRLCGKAAAGVPAAAAMIAGQKYQSSPAEWKAGDQDNGWLCLRFSISEPQYFQYTYDSTGTAGAVGDTFAASAHGDLNADSVLSTFRIHGKIDQSPGGGLEVFVSPDIEQIDAED